MPPGQGYQLWTDQNPPQGDDPLNQEGFLWDHPQMGKVFFDPKTGFKQVSPEWFQSNIRNLPEQLPAEGQAEAITPLAGGAAIPTATTANLAGKTGTQQAAERGRAGAETVQSGLAVEQAHKESDPLYGLDMTQRGQASKMAIEQGIPIEAAADLLRKELDAAGQAVAVEAAAAPVP